jgi:hypothetical protein
MRRLVLPLALCAALGGAALAQDQQQGGYHSVTCIKVRDGKMGEYREFMKESRKVGQVLADSGMMATSLRFRSVMPVGAAATCDFLFVNLYQGTPPAPLGPDAFAENLKKAHISMSADDYLARRSSLSQVVSSEMWRIAIQVGDIQKGDYAFLNYMKVHDADNWLELERSVWKPMAEAWVKDGTLHGWFVAQLVLPGGTGAKYQAVTLDVLPNWDATFKGFPVDKTWKQVHPDKDLNQVFEKLGKTRDLDLRTLVVLEDTIVPSRKPSSAGGQ